MVCARHTNIAHRILLTFLICFSRRRCCFFLFAFHFYLFVCRFQIDNNNNCVDFLNENFDFAIRKRKNENETNTYVYNNKIKELNFERHHLMQYATVTKQRPNTTARKTKSRNFTEKQK